MEQLCRFPFLHLGIIHTGCVNKKKNAGYFCPTTNTDCDDTCKKTTDIGNKLYYYQLC